MASSQPPRNSQGILRAITQAVTTVPVNYITKLVLKRRAKVPKIRIRESQGNPPQDHPLVGDRYILGRSSQSCTIVVKNSLVSKIHLSLSRKPDNPQAPFYLRDENSANGIYLGKRKIKLLPLRHGDVFSLGPPELADAPTLKYIDPPPWYVRIFRYSVFAVGAVTALAALIILFEWTRFQVKPLPSAISGPVIVYARDGQTPLRPSYGNAHYELNRVSKFSSYLPDALIASEDSRFYWHLGVDPVGVTRALLRNLRADEIREGGSTLTQQLARSLFRSYVGTDYSATRKVREAIVAMKLEAFYTKEELLLTYLNKVYLGFELYGFEDAARFYFDKSARDLSLAEAATLVGILPAPNSFNPVQDYKKALEQRDGVIYRMRQLGMVSKEEADRARRSRVEINPRAIEIIKSTIAPYYYSYVFDELEDLLGTGLAREGNLIVETALNPKMQKKAEASFENTMVTQGSYSGFSQGALVTIDSSKGEIVALVGGMDYQQSQFNRATQAQRQPGSTFKAFAYAAAIERGIPPQKLYSCAPLSWKGQNFSGCERSGGKSINMNAAMAMSENGVALRVAKDVGLERVLEMAQRLGIKSRLRAIPGLVLGQNEVNVLEITGAYGVFANKGVANRPHGIRRILDSGDCSDRNDVSTCRCIYSYFPDSSCENPRGDLAANRRVITPKVARAMTRMLQGAVEYGTGQRAKIGLGEGGKTGTTNLGVDLWFIGYIPRRNLVTGIWLGNDDNSRTYGGSSQAALLWGEYMGSVVKD